MNASDLMTNDFVSIDVNSTAAQLIGKLERAKKTYALVFDKKKYLGLITKKWLLSARIDVSVMKVKNALKKRHKVKTPFFVPKLSPETSLKEIARLLSASGVSALPVVKKLPGEKKRKFEKILGVVMAKDAVRELKTEYSGVRTDELAAMKPVCVNENDEIGKVIKTFSLNHVDRLPVVDKRGRLVGIASIIDILEKLQIWGRKRGQRIPKAASHGKWKSPGFDSGEKTDLLSTPISNVIRRFAMIERCSPATPVSKVIEQIARSGRASIVVVGKNDSPVGMITANDILRDYSK